MQAFFTTQHRTHAPESWLFKGKFAKAQEVPERADVLLAAARDGGHELREITLAIDAANLDSLKAVHDGDYLQYLQNAWQQWSQTPGTSAEITPNVHPNRHMHHSPQTLVAQAGYYQADGACPIGAGTWQGALASAQVAINAANALMDTPQTPYYALCRPPGHHAYADMAGGFCFLNNTAIAAQICLERGASKVAIIDVDVHHGNGTQGIFYDRADVLTVSLHGDPRQFYPFYAGHDDESGSGPGRGYNLNMPLPQGTPDDPYLSRLEAVLEDVRRFAPEVLVVALGLDASEHDPLAFFNISTPGFARIGAVLKQLALPTVLVQEGGYLSDHLGTNLIAALRGFES